jgi:hypothetical protein
LGLEADEFLEQDMIAVPMGRRPALCHGRVPAYLERLEICHDFRELAGVSRNGGITGSHRTDQLEGLARLNAAPA